MSADVTRVVEDDQGRGLTVVLQYDSSCERDGSILKYCVLEPGRVASSRLRRLGMLLWISSRSEAAGESLR